MADQDNDKKPSTDAQDEIDRVRASVINTPAPGTDPDTLRRNRKHADALVVNAGGDPAKDDKDEDNVDENNKDNDGDTKQTPAQKRAAANVSRTAAPQGRASAAQQTTE